MSQRDEQLSALLDNALDTREMDQFMQDLKRDPVDDAERMQRYQMVGDVIRDELSEGSFMDVSAAVHRAIQQEPELNTRAIKPAAKIFDFSAYVKPLTGMAIAASVAMVTVVAVRTVNTEAADQPLQAVAENKQVIESQQLARITPVNPAIAQHVRAASTDAPNQTQLRYKQLNEYMMNHSGYTGQASMQGMMPYARVVIENNNSR